MGIPAEADIFQVLEQLPKEQLTQMLSGMKEQFEEMPDSIVTQSAVLYVQEEYSAQGKDLDLFGPHSLYQYICAASTPFGRDCLADWLKRGCGSLPEWNSRREAVEELEMGNGE